MPEFYTFSNTSPLLYLHLIKRLELLPQLYGNVYIPPAVESELQAGAARGVNVPQVSALPWLQVMSLASTISIPIVMDLGRGEAEVIALGLENPHSRLILDDTLGRRIARLQQLQVTGTVGVVVKAKHTGLLPAVSPILDALRQAGLWLSDGLVAEVLCQAGEM
jgi:predicted nucleic acid-binding protein